MGQITRRSVLAKGAVLASAGIPLRSAKAATKITFLTSWLAQAEHGGFYHAKATGLYEKAGLDVTIKMGGPQVNGLQLLTWGEADIIMGYDIQTPGAVSKGLPIGTSFQFDPQGVMTHGDIAGIEDLKGHEILIVNASHVTFRPWLKQRPVGHPRMFAALLLITVTGVALFGLMVGLNESGSGNGTIA